MDIILETDGHNVLNYSFSRYAQNRKLLSISNYIIDLLATKVNCLDFPRIRYRL